MQLALVIVGVVLAVCGLVGLYDLAARRWAWLR
jgi:hypothetical protein